jgi:putative membrane protein
MIVQEGNLAQHMAVHIGEMNLAAPLCAAAILRARTVAPKHGHLALATALQVVLLWGWHTPTVLIAAASSPALMAAMHLSLFAVAAWFWMAVMEHVRRGSWLPIAALLITGKLFCLLGVLLTFAPRPIYWQVAFDPSGLATTMTEPVLADQQLAGLLMLAACPVVYVGAAIIVVRRWLAAADRTPVWGFRGGPA